MKLKKIIEGLEIAAKTGNSNPEVGGITFDSRQVNRGDLFVAVRGTQSDGHMFIDQAIQSGAVTIICEEDATEGDSEVARISVPDSQKALAHMAAVFYGHPSRELPLPLSYP